MPLINRLPTVSATDLSSADNLPVYSAANGDARKLSLSNLLTWFQTNFTSPAFTQTIVVPINGFSQAVNTSGNNEWILLEPGGTLATGTIVFPTKAQSVDGQEILITCTQTITTLTIDPSDATGFFGSPSSINGITPVKFRYNATQKSWYLVI